jgi:hypothetical protein
MIKRGTAMGVARRQRMKSMIRLATIELAVIKVTKGPSEERENTP